MRAYMIGRTSRIARLGLACLSTIFLSFITPTKALAQSTISPTSPPYNCYGDGTHDDTNCLTNALNASVGKELVLGNSTYLVCSTVSCSGGYVFSPPGPIHVAGVSTGWPSNKSSSIIVGTTNLSLFNLPTGSVLEYFYVGMGNAGTNASGAAITMANSSTSVNHLWIDSPCIGLELEGNTNYVDYTYLSNVTGSSCFGIRVGLNTTGASTVDPRVENTTIQGNGSNRPGADMVVMDAGGLYLNNNDLLYGLVGTLVDPSTNQWVAWTFASNSVLGDTTGNQCLVVNTAAPSAKVTGLQFTGDWCAESSNADLIDVANANGGLVTDIYFLGQRVYAANGAGHDGIAVNGGTNVDIDASHICGFNGNGVYIATGISGVRVRNSEIGTSCGGQSGYTGPNGVGFAGAGSTGVEVLGNDLTGVGTPIYGQPSGNSLVANNLGLDSQLGSIASAGTIALTNSFSNYAITGTNGINTISGYWLGRTVRLITTGGSVTFSTGGNICNSLTSTINVPVLATYLNSCWYLK